MRPKGCLLHAHLQQDRQLSRLSVRVQVSVRQLPVERRKRCLLLIATA